MTKTDEDVEPVLGEDEPPRFRTGRLVRWILIVAVATVGIMAVLTIMQEPL